MYIDPELINDVRKNISENANIKQLIEICGRWLSYRGIQAEWEDFDCTVEDVMSECYYIVEDNKILYCMVEEFLSDCCCIIKRLNGVDINDS